MSIIYLLAMLAAQESVPATTAAQAAPAGQGPAAQTGGNGSIIIYRGSSIMGAAIACPVRYRGQELVELGRGKYAEWPVPGGRYTLTNKTASVEVHVDPGETRYVRCQIKPGFMTGRSDLQIVDAESFDENRADYERKEIVSPLN